MPLLPCSCIEMCGVVRCSMTITAWGRYCLAFQQRVWRYVEQKTGQLNTPRLLSFLSLKEKNFPKSPYWRSVTVGTIDMLHIGELIKQEMERQERTPAWLARKINCERTNVYYIFRHGSINTEQLLLISRALGVDFFRYYSELVDGCK